MGIAQEHLFAVLDVGASAVVSPCGQYRYWLTRGREPRLPIVMLNPSTADESKDDPTIRRCMSFARREGYAGITVCNLFALRATDPAALRKHPDPFGPNNNQYLAAMIERATEPKTVLCAWGAFNFNSGITYAAEALLRHQNATLVCLGRTKEGAPRHPLFVAGNTPFEPFPGPSGWRSIAPA